MKNQLFDYDKKSNNLQLTRLVAAILVIFSHSFALSSGKNAHDWLSIISGGQLSLGGFSVSVFFLCSGYFASKSISQNNTGLFIYIKKRYIRLATPLAVVVISCILCGTFLSASSVKEYYSSPQTWEYLLNIVFILRHNLPGVFIRNIYGPTINGALWTIPVEFLCHIACYIAFKLKFLEKNRFRLIIMILITISNEILIYKPGISNSLIRAVILPASMFIIGMIYYVYGEYFRRSTIFMIFSIILFIILSVTAFIRIAVILFVPYICFYFWFQRKQISNTFAKLGDHSYSMYLWGFPVQQFIVHIFGGNMNNYLNFLLSTPVAIILGLLTDIIMKKASAYRKTLTAKLF